MRRINKEIFRNAITIKICGVNLKRLIKNIYKNEIEIYNLNLISHKELELTIKAKNLKKLKSLLKDDYNFNITKHFGVSFIKKLSLSHIGLIVGFLIFVLVNAISSKMLYNINIVGTEKISNEEIIENLSENGVKVGKFIGNFNVQKIEKTLENNFDSISFVSVIFKGNSLLINIKEKLFVEELEGSSNIIASENGIITKLDIVQGVTKFKVGDIVKKNDVLVEGRIGTKPCIAIANVELKIWYASSKNFFEEEKILTRTGKSFTNSYFSFYDNKFKIKKSENTFNNFEIETKENYLFKNNIIPIKLYKEIFYELKEIVVKNDFNLLKHDIIEETRREAKALVPVGVEIVNEFTEIVENENQKIITTFIETIQKMS